MITTAARPARPSGAESPVAHRIAATTSLLGIVVGSLELLAAAGMCVLPSQAAPDDTWAGLWYLFAIYVAVPALTGLVLSILGWIIRRSVPGAVLGVLGLGVALLPPLGVVLTFANQ